MSDFFEFGKIYVVNGPPKAPELLQLFDCRAIAPSPDDGRLVAFGFGTTAYPADYWSPAVRTQQQFDAGPAWTEYTTKPTGY